MKHVIIFLDYNSSRLNNPVYQLFSEDPADRRNITLLFLPRPMEDRDLMAEVATLRKKERSHLSDVTFHLCISALDTEVSSQLLQTAYQIRRLFSPDDKHHYNCFLYVLMAKGNDSSDKQLHYAWNNLTAINTAAIQYNEYGIFRHVFLYQDRSQKQLARFLYDVTHSVSLPQRPMEPYTPGSLYSPCFATFQTVGISYPEAPVRLYLRHKYIEILLHYCKAEINPTSLETCNKEAQRILSVIPMSDSRICLQEEGFINLEGSDTRPWKPVEKLWNDFVSDQKMHLKDIRHNDWLTRIRQRMELCFQSQFREVGVDYFFQLHCNKTAEYVPILYSLIRQEMWRIIQNHPYCPGTQKNIFRAVINLLQQRVIALHNLEHDTELAIQRNKLALQDIESEWGNMSFLSRLVHKHDPMLAKYSTVIVELFSQRSLLPGCRFAIKLLNELIPTLQQMQDDIETSEHLQENALLLATDRTKETEPHNALAAFGTEQLSQAIQALHDDRNHFLTRYQELSNICTGDQCPSSADALLASIDTQLRPSIDSYIDERIADGSLPPVLNQPISVRLDALHAQHGGLPAYIEQLKKQVTFTLDFRQNEVIDNYMLLTSTPTDTDGIEQIIIDDISQIRMLHLQYGLRLTDLNAFSGKRMFIEPAIF
ncbi:MAG: hypothetical protein K6E86_06330 [Bacteroidales bacterium]|nr:hypothetical protein [Bacteroidales bacterium]